jgi:hypothetical protein
MLVHWVHTGFGVVHGAVGRLGKRLHHTHRTLGGQTLFPFARGPLLIFLRLFADIAQHRLILLHFRDKTRNIRHCRP